MFVNAENSNSLPQKTLRQTQTLHPQIQRLKRKQGVRYCSDVGFVRKLRIVINRDVLPDAVIVQTTYICDW